MNYSRQALTKGSSFSVCLDSKASWLVGHSFLETWSIATDLRRLSWTDFHNEWTLENVSTSVSHVHEIFPCLLWLVGTFIRCSVRTLQRNKLLCSIDFDFVSNRNNIKSLEVPTSDSPVFTFRRPNTLRRKCKVQNNRKPILLSYFANKN